MRDPDYFKEPPARIFSIGDLVTKRTGSEWSGRVCGFYSTDLTPNGVCVESDAHKGSVQIYPAKALALVSIRTPLDSNISTT